MKENCDKKTNNNLKLKWLGFVTITNVLRYLSKSIQKRKIDAAMENIQYILLSYIKRNKNKNYQLKINK